ncbi:MAG TPA: MFS transporter [Tepidisphaeraceae bacterium]|jgi:fucose permease|nr:MFS transporter [Tepidisphaeraceae bacterium]
MRSPPALLTILAFLAYVSLGLPDAVPGVAWPFIRETFKLPISSLGTLLVTSMGGYLVASFYSGRLVNRIGVGGVLAGSGALIVAGMTGYALAPNWPVMVGFAVFAGLGAGAIDASLNLYAANHFRPRLMVWLHGCWGVGAVIGPLVMTAMVTSRYGWRGGYAVLAVMIAALSIAFLFTLRQWDDDPEPVEGAPPPPAAVSFSTALTDVRVWLNVLLYFFYTGLEISVGAWITSLMREARHVPEAQAGTATAFYFASITAGRFVIGSIANRVPSELIVRAATWLAPLVILLIWLPKSYSINVVALMLLGFLISPLFPLWMSLTPVRLGPAVTAHAVGLQMAAASLGMSLIPGALGYIARWQGLEAIPIAFLALALIVLTIHEFARRMTVR